MPSVGVRVRDAVSVTAPAGKSSVVVSPWVSVRVRVAVRPGVRVRVIGRNRSLLV